MKIIKNILSVFKIIRSQKIKGYSAKTAHSEKKNIGLILRRSLIDLWSLLRLIVIVSVVYCSLILIRPQLF